MLFILTFLFVVCSALRKRGIDWWGQDANLKNLFVGGNISWYYNWNQEKSFEEPSFQFVPMVRAESDLDYFQNVKIKNGDIKILLGFNEPDDPGQANMTPEKAAELYKTVFKPLKNQGKIGRLSSPAVTNNGLGPEGWLSRFLNLCGDCGIDFVTYHWYANSFSYWEQCYQNASAFGYPLWITEWAVTSWDPNNPVDLSSLTTQTQSIMNHLETHDNVERYAYFAVGPLTGSNDAAIGYNTALISLSNTLTPLGVYYRDAPANDTTDYSSQGGPDSARWERSAPHSSLLVMVVFLILSFCLI